MSLRHVRFPMLYGKKRKDNIFPASFFFQIWLRLLVCRFCTMSMRHLLSFIESIRIPVYVHSGTKSTNEFLKSLQRRRNITQNQNN